MPDQFDPDPLLLPGKSPADPSQAAGFLGGAGATALGIPDAIRALRGQMDPEEAKQFALLAGLSLVPGARMESAAAKFAPGFARSAAAGARNLANIGKEGTGYAHPVGGHASGMEASGPIFPETPEGEFIYAAQKAKQKAAEKEYESTPWRPTASNEYATYFPDYIQTSGVPEHLPTQIPERARQAGFNIPLAHGTRYGGFEEFKLPEELPLAPKTEIGVHAGSPKAANRFGGTALEEGLNPQVYPLVMRARNPIESEDLGNWGPRQIARWLDHHPEFGKEAVSAALKGEEPTGVQYLYSDSSPTGMKSVAQIQALRDLIKSKGYDSIKYKNTVEDPGHTSYIALDPKQIRSPWAAFKDLESRNLLAGLAGGAVATPVVAPQVQEYVKALSK